MRRRGGRKRALGTRASIALPEAPNQRWSLDFVSDTLTDGRRFRSRDARERLVRDALRRTGGDRAAAIGKVLSDLNAEHNRWS